MLETAPLHVDQMNNLWLGTEYAIGLFRSAEKAARTVDELVRAALSAGSSPEAIAATAFINIDLIDHVHAGGTTSDYLREHTSGDDRAKPGPE